MDDQHRPSQGTGKLTLLDLLFVGFRSRVVALDRYSGEIVWTWKAPKGRASYVAVLLEDDRLMVSVQGYTYCLNPLNGQLVWHNPLRGHGIGIPSLASFHGSSSSAAAAAAVISAQQRRSSTHGAPPGA